MIGSGKIDTLYLFFLAYLENPRIPKIELHRAYSHFKTKDATYRLLDMAKKEQILVGPRIWCNSGFDVELVEKTKKDPLDLFEEFIQDPIVTYIMALEGAYSFLLFKKGASRLKFAEVIKPSYPAKKSIEHIRLEKSGVISGDPYPHGWDELDWEVYNTMRDPTISYWKASQGLDSSWQTVKRHFKRILNDCKIWIAFYPQGYRYYSQAILTFKTEYESALIEELSMLDRSSFLYKFDDTLILHLFYDNSIQHYTFSKLEKEGKIHDLHVSIPVRHFSKLL